jgi:hypothetical protein
MKINVLQCSAVLPGKELLTLKEKHAASIFKVFHIQLLTLKMEATCLSEMSGNIQKSAHYHIHENFIIITL